MVTVNKTQTKFKMYIRIVIYIQMYIVICMPPRPIKVVLGIIQKCYTVHKR